MKKSEFIKAFNPKVKELNVKSVSDFMDVYQDAINSLAKDGKPTAEQWSMAAFNAATACSLTVSLNVVTAALESLGLIENDVP